MYEYNVGIIAEGPTDVEVIEGILRTVFAKDTFCFRTISPTPQELQSQRKKEGFGWGGVYRVCKDLREKLEMLTLMGAAFDLLVIHVDGDVAYKDYADIEEQPLQNDLPCASVTAEVQEAGSSLEDVVCQWLNHSTDISIPVVLCLPFLSTETWAGQLLYPGEWTDIDEKTSEDIIYHRLFLLGQPKSGKERRLIRQKAGKMKKNTKGYQNLARQMTAAGWMGVTQRYVQAKRFDAALKEETRRVRQ